MTARRVRRLGLHLFLQRRRPPHSGRAARVRLASRTRRSPGSRTFTATGSGTFDAPRNDYKFRVNDLFVGEEGVGQVTGTLTLRGSELSGEIDAASPRLAVTGTGRIALTLAVRLRAHVPVPRHLARPLRAPVRAAPLAVHHRRRQRVDPRRRRAGGRRATCSSTARWTRSTCGCSTTR